MPNPALNAIFINFCWISLNICWFFLNICGIFLNMCWISLCSDVENVPPPHSSTSAVWLLYYYTALWQGFNTCELVHSGAALRPVFFMCVRMWPYRFKMQSFSIKKPVYLSSLIQQKFASCILIQYWYKLIYSIPVYIIWWTPYSTAIHFSLSSNAI